MRVWLRSLLAAAVSGAATMLGALVLDFDHFNFGSGLKHLGLVALAGAASGVWNYLRQSPLPSK